MIPEELEKQVQRARKEVRVVENAWRGGVYGDGVLVSK